MIDKLNELRARRAEISESREGGFTLIELLVVVVIIGILIAIAIPLYLNYENGAKNKSTQSDVRNLITAVQQCTADNNAQLPASGSQAGSIFTLVIGTANCTTTATASSSDTLTYALDTTHTGNYTLTGTNSDTNKTYTYNSWNSSWT